MVRIADVCMYIYFNWRLDEFCVTSEIGYSVQVDRNI